MSDALAAPASAATTVTVTHSEGSIEVPASLVMQFTEALWGFPNRREYALLPAARHGLWWLMSVGEPAVTFVLADPFQIDPNYGLDLGDTERVTLGLSDPTDALALVLVTLPAAGEGAATANMRAPIVFNLAARRAAQVISRDDAHALKQPIDLTIFPINENGVRVS